MDVGDLKTTLGTVKMPPQMGERIIKNCKAAERMKRETRKTGGVSRVFLKRPILATAAVFILAVLTAVGAAAAAGYFRDVVRGDGAVVGTAYEQATDEIQVRAAVSGEDLLVTVTQLCPDRPPYSECEQFAIGDYQIEDMSQTVIREHGQTEACPVSGGQAQLKISLAGMDRGSYKLIIRQFVGSKKADQPLKISGTWACEFAF